MEDFIAGVGKTIANLEQFQEKYESTPSDETSQVSNIYSDFIENLQENKGEIESLLEGKVSQIVGASSLTTILGLITQLEGPAQQKDRQEKVVAVQNSMFWNTITDFKEQLVNLQDLLKRGQKVEGVDLDSFGGGS